MRQTYYKCFLKLSYNIMSQALSYVGYSETVRFDSFQFGVKTSLDQASEKQQFNDGQRPWCVLVFDSQDKVSLVNITSSLPDMIVILSINSATKADSGYYSCKTQPPDTISPPVLIQVAGKIISRYIFLYWATFHNITLFFIFSLLSQSYASFIWLTNSTQQLLHIRSSIN